MKRFTFYGRLLPERVSVSIATPLKGEMVFPDLAARCAHQVFVHHGQLAIHVTVLEGGIDLLTLKNSINDLAHSIADLVGYQRGIAFDVEIIAATDCDADDAVVFGIDIPAIASTRKPGNYSQLESAVVDATLSDFAATSALADFREAIRNAVGTGFFCYRAVEAIMQTFKTGIKSEKSAWEKLRSHLNVAREAIDTVKKHADFPRHGRPWTITDAERALVFRITDEILRRYFIFIARARTQLPLAEFPLLDAGGPTS